MLKLKPRLLGLGLFLIAVAATCTTAPPAPSFPPIRFADKGKISLRVRDIQIVQEYSPPLEAPNVEHEFAIPPAKMAEQWAHDRLVAAGGTATARFVIRKASVIESELPRTEGVRGAFTIDQAQRYDADVSVNLEIVNDRGFADQNVEVETQRSRSVAENISLADRQSAWYDLTVALGNDLDAQLAGKIPAALPKYIAYQ